MMRRVLQGLLPAWLLAPETVVWRAALSRDAVASRLRDRLDSPWNPRYWFAGSGGEDRYVGRVSGNTFWIGKVTSGMTSFSTRLRGRLLLRGETVEIRGHFAMYPPMRALSLVCVAGAVAGACAGLGVLLFTAVTRTATLSTVVTVLGMIGVAVAIAGVVLLGRTLDLDRQSEIIAFVDETLGDHVTSKGA